MPLDKNNFRFYKKKPKHFADIFIICNFVMKSNINILLHMVVFILSKSFFGKGVKRCQYFFSLFLVNSLGLYILIL